MNEMQVVQALGALAQETRLRLFRLLVVDGEHGLTPGHMADALNVSPNTLSFHLKELSHAGLITSERDGRNLLYRAHFGVMSELLGFLTEKCCGGRPCLDAAVSCS